MTIAVTCGKEPKASEFHLNLSAMYASPLSLWFDVHDDKPDNKLDALCESVPKWGSIVIKLAALEPSTFGSALKKLESELATDLWVLSAISPSKVTWLSLTNIAVISSISPSETIMGHIQKFVIRSRCF